MVVSTGGMLHNSELRTYRRNTEIVFSARTVQFYYLSSAAASTSVLRVTMASSKDKPMEMSYIVIIIISLAGLITLYGIFSCIRLCLRSRTSSSTLPLDAISAAEQERLLTRILDESPVGKYHYHGQEDKFKQLACAVCLAELEQNCDIRSLVCGHVFHKLCIETWIKAKIQTKPRCPICNTELVKQQLPHHTQLSQLQPVLTNSSQRNIEPSSFNNSLRQPRPNESFSMPVAEPFIMISRDEHNP